MERWTDRRTDRQTTVKQYPLIFQYRGIKIHISAFTKQQNFRLLQIESIEEDIFNVATIIISVFYGVENIVGKGENARYH